MARTGAVDFPFIFAIKGRAKGVLARPGAAWRGLARFGFVRYFGRARPCQSVPGRASPCQAVPVRAKGVLARPLSHFNRKNEGEAMACQAVPWKSALLGPTTGKRNLAEGGGAKKT